jgi:serine/threonine-protein kinase HipA
MSAASEQSHLTVWLNSSHVADLYVSRRDQLSLSYTDEAVSAYGLGGLCLSVALPVQRARYEHVQVFPWVEGLLPEGEARTVLEQEFSIRRGDTFGLLAKIGRDCAGAVAFYESEQMPSASSSPLAQLSDAELDEAIVQLPARPLGVDGEVRVSLGGLQAKLLLVQMSDGGWARPAHGSPSTHILKPEPADYPGLAAAEVFTLRAASACSIDAAEASLAHITGRPVVIVKRFDRITDDSGRIVRVHQEDASQALSLDASDTRSKYQYTEAGPPTLAQVAGVIRIHGKPVVQGLTRLLQMVVFNIAIGNTDAHARNYSFMFGGGGVAPAPLYDSAPTCEFESTRTVALWVDGQAMLSAITLDHLMQEGLRWSIPERVTRRVVNEVVDALPEALERAAGEVPEASPKIVENAMRRAQALRSKPRLPR